MLTPSEDARRLNTPPLQGRGRGWGLSAEHLAVLHARAKQMRNNPTEPEKRLWRVLSGSRLGGFKFRRQAVVPPYIVDFLNPRYGLAIEVDGETHDDPAADARRDTKLGLLGYRVVYVSNLDVMSNIEGVAETIETALRQTKRRGQPPHPNPSPEGEGL